MHGRPSIPQCLIQRECARRTPAGCGHRLLPTHTYGRPGIGRLSGAEARTQSLAEGTRFMSHDVKVLVTGAGGFIGHHLVTFLKGQGYWV